MAVVVEIEAGGPEAVCHPNEGERYVEVFTASPREAVLQCRDRGLESRFVAAVDALIAPIARLRENRRATQREPHSARDHSRFDRARHSHCYITSSSAGLQRAAVLHEQAVIHRYAEGTSSDQGKTYSARTTRRARRGARASSDHWPG